MVQSARFVALLAAAATSAGCYAVETHSRDLPPRSTAEPAQRSPPPAPPRESPERLAGTRPIGNFLVPADRVPAEGLCRIWYDQLPPDRQPATMSCARAHRLARNHGGRVIWAKPAPPGQEGEVSSVEYGRVDFEGVPPDRLPPPGYCRVWLDGVSPDQQPPPGKCPDAEREAQEKGGRLLYIPSSDVR